MLRNPWFHRSLLSLATCVVPVVSAHAQIEAGGPLDPALKAHQYVHQSWSERDGYPGGIIQDITQTADGYLWLATTSGVVRFDGIRFTLFSQLNTSVFTTDVFEAITVDREGTLWIGSPDGLFSYRDRTFTRYSDDDGLSDVGITALLVDDDGALLVGTHSGGVNRYRDGVFTQTVEATAGVSRLYQDRSGALWVVTDEGDVIGHDGDQTVEYELSRQFARDLAEDRSGTLWVAAAFGLLPLHEAASIPRPEESPGRVWRVAEDSQGTLWVGTVTNGLFRLRSGVLEQVPFGQALTVAAEVRALFEDRTGALWVATGGVLNRFHTGAFTTYTVRDGLSSDRVTAVLEDRDRALWIGTLSDGLNRMEDGVVSRFGRGTGLPAVLISTLFEDRDSALWVVVGGRLGQFAGGMFTEFPDAAKVAPGGLHRPAQGRDGTIWFANRLGGGLTSYAGGRFHPFSDNEELQGKQVSRIHEDSEGTLWIATENSGLYRYQDGSLTAFTTDDGLSSNQIRAIHESPSLPNVLWVGTFGGGINRVEDGKIVPITRAAGMINDVVLTILEDDLERLWIGTERGVFQVPLRELEAFARGDATAVRPTEFDVLDGLKDPGVVRGTPGGWKSADGRLWFTTRVGVSVIDPASHGADGPPPNLVIEDVLVDDTSLDLTESALSPGRRDFEFRFAAPGLIAPRRARLRYRLDGYDSEWNDAGDRRSAFYTQLPPGDYRFRVGAVAPDGTASEAEAVFDLSVAPFFFETTWFLILALVTAATALFQWHGWRMASVEARRATLEAEVRHRIAAEEELIDSRQGLRDLSQRLISVQEEERGRLARELHDELGQAMTAVHLNLQTMERSDSLEAVRGRATDSMSVIDRLLDQIRAIALDLRPPMLDDLGLVAALRWYAQRQSERSGVSIEVEDAADQRPTSGEVDSACFRIAQEAVTNTLRHADADSIRMALEERDGHLVLQVTDDGRGFDRASSPHRRNQGSMGLTGMKERAALAGGTLDVESTPGKGTVVRASFPLTEGNGGPAGA